MAKIKVNVFATSSDFEPVGKNFSIAVSDWILDGENYFAIVQDTRLNLNKFADVFFDKTCLDTVKDAKISAEIAEVTLRSGSDDMFVYTNVIAIKFTAENLPTDSISGVYYLFEEENYMAKVRLNPCGGNSGAVTLNGAEVNNVTITGAEVTIQGKNATVASGAGTQKQNPNFAVNPSAVTLQAFTQEIVTVSSASPAPWQAYSTDSDLSVSVKDNHVTLKSGAPGSNKDVSCNFYQLGTQNFKDAYLDFPVHLVKLDALKGKFSFENNLDDSSGCSDVTWNNSDYLPNIEFVDGVNGKAVKKKSAGNNFYLTPTGLSLGGRDFTTQFWMKDIEGSQTMISFDSWNTAKWTNNAFRIEHCDTTKIYLYSPMETYVTIDLETDIKADFHHYAFVYSHDNSTFKFFFDGVCKYTATQTVPNAPITGVMLGNSYGNNNAAFDNLEIYDGLALYSEDFTPNI